MRKLCAMSLVAGVVLLAGMAGTVEACYCGAARYSAMPPGVRLRGNFAVLHRDEGPANRSSMSRSSTLATEPATSRSANRRRSSRCAMCPKPTIANACRRFCRPVYETAEREVCYTVCRPVKEMQTVKVCAGHWETKEVTCCMPKACDPCAPAVQATKQCRVWVPEMVEKQVECVKYVPETVTKKVPYTTCRMVSRAGPLGRCHTPSARRCPTRRPCPASVT